MIDTIQRGPGINIFADTVNVFTGPIRVPVAYSNDRVKCEDCCWLEDGETCFWYDVMDLNIHSPGFICPHPKRSNQDAKYRDQF